MRSILVMSAGLLLGCAAPPVQQAQVEGNLIGIGGADFVVFHQEEQAYAVYLGPNSAGAVIPAAQRAIEKVTGCPVAAKSLTANAKTVSGQLLCYQRNSLFARARATERGRTTRSGLGPSAKQLLELRDAQVQDSVALKQRVKKPKQ